MKGSTYNQLMGCQFSTQVQQQRYLLEQRLITLIDLSGAIHNHNVPGRMKIFEVKTYLYENLGHRQLRPDQVSLLLEDGRPIPNESIIAILPQGVVLWQARANLTEIMPQAQALGSERGGSYQMQCGYLVSRDQMHAYLAGIFQGYDVIHMQGGYAGVRCVKHLNCIWELSLCQEVAVMTATMKIKLEEKILLGVAESQLMKRRPVIEKDPQQGVHLYFSEEEFKQEVIWENAQVEEHVFISVEVDLPNKPMQESVPVREFRRSMPFNLPIKPNKPMLESFPAREVCRSMPVDLPNKLMQKSVPEREFRRQMSHTITDE